MKLKSKEHWKAVVKDTKRATARETNYLACKASGFNHKGSAAEEVKVNSEKRG
jgi:hypothetical protein